MNQTEGVMNQTPTRWWIACHHMGTRHQRVGV